MNIKARTLAISAGLIALLTIVLRVVASKL